MDVPPEPSPKQRLRTAQRKMTQLCRYRLELSVQLAGLDQKHASLQHEILRLERRIKEQSDEGAGYGGRGG